MLAGTDRTGVSSMTLLRADQPYWFLYEGTPGGKLDVDSDFWVASDGVKHPAAERWNGHLPAPEWAYFGDAKLKRVLFLANHQNDAITDERAPGLPSASGRRCQRNDKS